MNKIKPNNKIVEQILNQYIENNSVLPLIGENKIVICSGAQYFFDDMIDMPSEIEITSIDCNGKITKMKYFRKEVE